MPYRILEYEMAIIKSAVDVRKLKNKSYKIPLVVPIVLYTGKTKWNAKQYLEDSQEKLENIDVKLSNYNLVDINEIPEEELLNENTLISKVMLLEKSSNREELIMYLEKILPRLKKEDRELMSRILKIILQPKLGEMKTLELLKMIEGDDNEMLAVIEMLEKERKTYIDIGRKEGKAEAIRDYSIEIVKKMLENEFSTNMICKITNMKKEEVEKIKKDIDKS